MFNLLSMEMMARGMAVHLIILVILMESRLGITSESQQCQLDGCIVRDEIKEIRTTVRGDIREASKELREETHDLIKEGRGSLREDIAQLIQDGRQSLREKIRELIREEFGNLQDGTRPRDCADIKKSEPSSPSGVYKVFPVGIPELEVYCDMDTDDGGWLVFQKRLNGEVDFNRNWADYAAGFGSLDGEFWLGNRALSLLTKQAYYTLRVDLSNWADSTAFAVYSDFRISPETTNFTLNLGVYSGNAGDSMGLQRRLQFTTLNRFNGSIRSGWWYHYSEVSSLNGFYTQRVPSIRNFFQWSRWSVIALKSTEMKIRPGSF